MPTMDGTTLAREIRGDQAIRQTRLVMVTSAPRRGDGTTMQRLGFDAYLTKPVKQRHLRECLLSLVGRYERKEVEEPARLITRHTLNEAARDRYRILLVEDNVVNQKVARHLLERLGYRCDLATNGREAVSATDRKFYDLVLMDCHMPEMDGFEATAAIRDREGNTRHTPIIAMTALAMTGDRERCLDAGMDDYIPKPIDVEVLRDKLTAWLDQEGGS